MRVVILAIDPGNLESAYVLYDASHALVVDHGKCPNSELLGSLHDDNSFRDAKEIAIEMIASYGMPVGR